MFGKKYDKRQMRKIYNLIQVTNDGTELDADKMDYIISQAISIFSLDIDKKINSMNDEQKIKLKEKVMDDIVKCLGQYEKYKEKRKDMDTISISWNKKDYTSKYINIDIYYYINSMIKNSSVDDLSESVLYKIFEGILSIDILEEIKVEDPLYYEIILDDVSNLISNTLEKILSIKTIKRENATGGMISYKPIDAKTDLYALFLENFNKTPEEVNSNKAVDIFKTVSEISRKQFVREAEEDLKGMQGDKASQGAYAEQIRKQLEDGDK